MANIRKSFNFRNGVQVDNDNFVVNANGLVGIGTSVPQTYLLNVYGDTRTTGLTTTRDLYVSGITTVGFITASSMGITTDLTVGGTITAQSLSLANGVALDNVIGYAFTAFITDNAGIGLHTTSKIGINTTTSPGASDSALEVFGDVNVTGIITATTFSGNVNGTVNGVINASSGVSTFTELKVGTAITMSAGIVTATTFNGNLNGTVNGVINASSGVSTFTELKVGTAITMSAGIITATTFSGSGANLTNLPTSVLTGTISTTQIANGAVTDAKIDTVSASKLTGALPAISGASLTSVPAVSITGSPNTILGVTTTGNLNAGTIVGTGLSVTSIGIGTASPTDALHIQQSGAAEIYVGSDSAASSLRVGRNLDDNDSGMVKYGNTSGIYPYSTEKSLDFMNFGQGNVNFYIEAGITTTSDFNFNWNKGGNTNLMTLTKGGNLGIGITNPTHKLNVQGISTFTDNAHFNSNVTIDGSLNFSAGANITATLIGDVQNSSSNVILDVSVPRVNANVFIQTGISTFNEVSIGSTSKSENVVIGGGNVVRTDLEDVITANNETNRFFVNSSGSIGIKTTISYGLDIGVNCTTKQALFSGVGIGTTSMRCAVDFADAGTLGVTTHTYLVPPKVSTSNRNGIAGTITGATIYNITDNKLQVYTGSTWETITSS